jgi:signal transduction histidine kinase
VYDLRFDARGALWAATIGGGVVRFDSPGAARPAARAWTVSDGLPSNEVTCLTEDLAGRLWIGTTRGVARLDPENGEIRRFTTADGLANHHVRAAYRDRQGDLWFGTLQGLSRLRGASGTASPPLRAVITSIEVAGVPRPLAEDGATDAGRFRAARGADRLRVGFTAPSADLDQPPHYRYRLVGFDDAWSAPTRDRAVTYGSLRPGSYRFEVVASDEAGSAASPAGFDVEIPSPPWRSGWAIALYALLALGAAWLAHRARLARLLAVERVRTRIAADLHDDLGASLSRIAVLSEIARRSSSIDGSAAPELEEIADTARRITEEADDIVWAIDPSQDDLARLLARVRPLAADLLGDRGIELDWDAPSDAPSVRLAADRRRHLLLVLKEALHNAARHSGARRVAVRVEAPRDAIRVEVSDDGVGFDPADPPASASGRGLASLRARAAALGGRLELLSKPGAGTTVRLEIER